MCVCVCVCVCMYIYTCIHIYIYIYMYMFSNPDHLTMMHFAASCKDATNPLLLMRRIIFECTGKPPPSQLGISSFDPKVSASSWERVPVGESFHER